MDELSAQIIRERTDHMTLRRVVIWGTGAGRREGDRPGVSGIEGTIITGPDLHLQDLMIDIDMMIDDTMIAGMTIDMMIAGMMIIDIGNSAGSPPQLGVVM